jgi:hypothetical protein
LNLNVDEARDIGAAIGCDFFIVGDSQTLRRSPSTGAAYYESYASIFLVSARTGRLILWGQPLTRASSLLTFETNLPRVCRARRTRGCCRCAG